MTLRTRLVKLERAAADAGLEPPCPGCDYPNTSVPFVTVERDELDRLGRCPECTRPLDFEGRPVRINVIVLEHMTEAMESFPFPPAVQAMLAQGATDPLSTEGSQVDEAGP